VLSDKQNYGYILQSGLILTVLVVGIARSNIGFRTIVKWVSMWLGVAVVLLAGYSYQYELKVFAQRIFGQLVPSSAVDNPDGSISFYASNNGHFMIDATVHSQVVHFLLDTGASRVTLTQQDAKRIGINTDALKYNVPLSTANGTSFAAPIVIDEIHVGNIVVRDVFAYVSKSGLDTSLLGMSFLNRLTRYEVARDSIKIWGKSR